MPVAINMYAVADLALDPENPRLPESVQRRSPSELLRYLFETASLDELEQSFADSGFFAHEPLIVLEQSPGNKHIVLEGNRRLATLLILHGVPEAEGLVFGNLYLSKDQRDRLREVPCYAIKSREEVHRYLGFRHIGGIKAWDPEAKARYLLGEIERAARERSADPFRDVGRQVGSNALGVRNPYIAIKLLYHARTEFGIDPGYVQRERFGVWLRCMNSREIRDYIGLGSPTTYAEIGEALRHLHADRLRDVLADLTPQEGRRRALLADSRDVTDYGRILAEERALAVLRKHEDMEVARQVIDELSLVDRVRRLTDSCRVILDQVQLADEIQHDLVHATDALEKVAGSLNSTVLGRLQKAAKK